MGTICPAESDSYASKSLFLKQHAFSWGGGGQCGLLSQSEMLTSSRKSSEVTGGVVPVTDPLTSSNPVWAHK